MKDDVFEQYYRSGGRLMIEIVHAHKNCTFAATRKLDSGAKLIRLTYFKQDIA